MCNVNSAPTKTHAHVLSKFNGEMGYSVELTEEAKQVHTADVARMGTDFLALRAEVEEHVSNLKRLRINIQEHSGSTPWKAWQQKCSAACTDVRAEESVEEIADAR